MGGVLNSVPTYIRRSVDAVLQSIILMGGSVLVYLWLQELNYERVPDLERLITITGGIGLMIGAIVPTWYRNSYATEPEHKHESTMAESSMRMDMLAT